MSVKCNKQAPGVKGFEPLNVGTKNRRLTTWLYSTFIKMKNTPFQAFGSCPKRTSAICGAYLNHDLNATRLFFIVKLHRK